MNKQALFNIVVVLGLIISLGLNVVLINANSDIRKDIKYLKVERDRLSNNNTTFFNNLQDVNSTLGLQQIPTTTEFYDRLPPEKKLER